VSSLDISVEPAHLYSCDTATFTINITNAGETHLDPVKVLDTLPLGVSYVSDNRNGSLQGQKILWRNIGRLDIGASTQIKLVTRIDSGTTGWLENFVTVIGVPPTGYSVMDNDTVKIFISAHDEKSSADEESLTVGDQSALAVNALDEDGFASIATAENHNNLQEIQTRNGGISNRMKLIEGNESSIAIYSASSINKRKISSTKR
jgi:uncharacterized repeat protein (TIGR01451 family)